MKYQLVYLSGLLMLILILTLLSLSGCGDEISRGVIQGPKGDTGATGATGQKGDTGLSGLQGIQGIVGPSGIQGQVGPQGIQGLIGPAGIQGIPGSAGTVVTFVQFCPGATVYPSTFPEFGLCVAGQIYAVYSANGGFGVQLPLGAYSSDGINSSCSFNVLANCVITH